MTEANHENSVVTYLVSPSLTNDALNTLLAAAWHDHTWGDFQPVLSRSLAFVCAYQENRLVGFVNLAWDGGEHAFILDTLVHPEFRRRGVGRELVRRAVAVAEGRDVKWVHVDFEPHLQSFYDGCGFRSTAAGLIRLRNARVNKLLQHDASIASFLRCFLAIRLDADRAPQLKAGVMRQ